MARTEILPDGRAVLVPDDMSREEALAITGFTAAAAPQGPALEEENILQDTAGSIISGVGQLVALPSQLYGLATGDFDTAWGDFAKSVTDYGENIKTEGLRAREAAAGQRIDAAEEQGFWSGLGTGLYEYMSDPRLLASGIAETIPSLFGTAGTGALVSTGAKKLLAREIAEQAAARAAAGRVGLTAAERAVQRAGVSGGVGFGAVQQGADVGTATYERAMALPDQVWAQNPDFMARVEAGEAPDQVKADMALSAARTSALAATGVSALTAGVLPGTFEKAVLGKSLAGQGILPRAGKSFLGEAGQEAAEEGGGALAQNIALQQINPEQALLEGVGSQAAIGALLGGVSGAGGAAAFGGGPQAEAPAPGRAAAPARPTVAPEVPPQLLDAPVIGTVDIPTQDDAGNSGTATVEILSEPDEGGNVWVRAPDGNITSVPKVIIDRFGGIKPSAPVEMPAPPVTPPVAGPVGIGEPTPVEAPAPPEAAPIAPPVATPLPEPGAEPIDVVPPTIPEAPVPEAPVPGAVPGAAAPGAAAPGALPPVAAPPEAATPEPGESIPPAAADEVFTEEEGALSRVPSEDLAASLRGKNAIQGVNYLSKNAKTPYIRRIATQTGKMMKALQNQGYQFNFKLVSPTTKSNDPRLAKSIQRFKKDIDSLGQVSTYSNAAEDRFMRGDILLKDVNYPGAKSGANDVTATHEFIHAATAALIYQFENGNISPDSRVGKAVSEMIELHKASKKYYRGVKDGSITASQKTKDVVESLTPWNAFQNVHELLTYGLTDWRMQHLLKQLEVNKVNGFTAFVRAIGKMLGFSKADTNGLRRLIELSEELLPSDAAKREENARLAMYGDVSKQVTPSEEIGAQETLSTTEAEQEPGVTPTPISEEAAPEVEPTPAATPEAVPEGPSAALNEQGRAFIQIPLGDETRMDRYRRVWADRMRRLGFVEEAIEKATGAPISRTVRPTEKAALFEGRAQERLDELQRDHLNKILDVMKRLGITPNEADLFLLARTAPDRNAKIAERNPNMPDGGSGLTNEEAQAIMSEFITSGRMPAMQEFASVVDAMTQNTRDTLVKYGMLTEEQAKALVESEPFYVPLKGLAEDGDLSVSGDNVHRPPNSGRGFSISRKEFLATKGRSSLPFSPLANAMADAQAAIVRGERNRVGQSFLNDIARKYDSNAWQIFTDENPEMQSIYNSKTKKVETRPVQMELFPERYFIVKEDGKPYYIKIHDPLLMRALTNGSSRDFAAVNKFLGSTIGAATQALSRLHTTLNPEFFVPNFARDIEAAVFNILAEQDAVDGRLAGKKIVKDVLKDVKSIKNFRMLFKATFNHEATTDEQRDTNALFQQAKEDGAFTGWIVRETPESQMDKIKDEIERASATGKEKVWYSTQDKARSIFQKIQDFNSVFENVTRFAVYKNALKAGLTRDEAANMARNVTVDFNKKGEAGPTANALYAFFNAAVRGNAQLIRSLTAKSADGKYTRAQKMAMGMIAFGILQTVIGRGMSDEDDDGMLVYDKIPDWEKQRNIIMMMPNGRDYLKIPLPYGYSFFHTLGSLGAEVGAGTKTAGDMGVGVISGLLNNFSPVPIGGESLSGIAASTVPTVLRPFADLMINENFFGSPIYNEPFDENQAMSSVSRFSTPEGYKAIVEFLNEATGGRGKVAGGIDIPAESIEYLLNSYIGGAGKFGADLIDMGGKVVGGRDVEMRNIPVFRKVLGEPNTQNDLGLYYERLNQIQPTQRQYRDSRGDERRMLREQFPVETNHRVAEAMKMAQKQIKAVNQQKRNLLSRDMDEGERQDRLDRLNERQHLIYLRFNRIYNQASE